MVYIVPELRFSLDFFLCNSRQDSGVGHIFYIKFFYTGGWHPSPPVEHVRAYRPLTQVIKLDPPTSEPEAQALHAEVLKGDSQKADNVSVSTHIWDSMFKVELDLVFPTVGGDTGRRD